MLTQKELCRSLKGKLVFHLFCSLLKRSLQTNNRLKKCKNQKVACCGQILKRAKFITHFVNTHLKVRYHKILLRHHVCRNIPSINSYPFNIVRCNNNPKK
ncbi:hypothetical protein CIPAW_01G162100 [Carya illinoinensis]|uniref:Uncharacterized protein n=1 Tax=Carya illinoinensis TaxID=32201 RepID=A0A8T1RN96_CARIL|nr:hypothetical protein CIPAW_01G162100 [Carya illinoinensis]